MKAEIITIGDEILIGQIIDSNSAHIANELFNIGIEIFQISSVSDDKKHIIETVKNAEKCSDLIILTGGLGPTNDDITKSVLTEYFNDTLVQNEDVLLNIKKIWKKYIKQPLLKVNLDQAMVPSRSIVLMNYIGSAPGIWYEKRDKIFIALPGVPSEMKSILKLEVLPKLTSTFDLPAIVKKTILTYGLGESMIAKRINDWENNLPKSIKFAYLPSLGRVRLRISSIGINRNEVANKIEFEIQKLLPLISDIFIGFEEDNSIEKIIGSQLVKLNKTLSIAESCSGGGLAAKFTANPGSSKFFKGGMVAYDTKSKISILGVDPNLIFEQSVVSLEVAESMAIGVKKIFSSDYAISTTGNAGPTKGESDAGIGNVCIAIATPGKVFSKQFSFGTGRDRVLTKTINMALTLFQREIFKN
tara:strand:- start:140381 stop:141628 length:1248 start_codon:yes stop_codon:yes gene_type:complete